MAHTAEQSRTEPQQESSERSSNSRWSGNRRRNRSRSNSSWECMSLVIHTNSEAVELSPLRTARSASCPDHVSIFSLACVKNENRTGQSDSRTRGTRQERVMGGKGRGYRRTNGLFGCATMAASQPILLHILHILLLYSTRARVSIQFAAPCSLFIFHLILHFFIFELSAPHSPDYPQSPTYGPHSPCWSMHTLPAGLIRFMLSQCVKVTSQWLT